MPTKEKSHANFSKKKEVDERLFYNCHIAGIATNEAWLIDSAWCNHMTGNECIFTNLETFVKSKVRLTNTAKVEAKEEEIGRAHV